MQRAVFGIGFFVTVAASVSAPLACGHEPECDPVGETCINATTRRVCSGVLPFTEKSVEACEEGQRCIEDVWSNGQKYAACAIGGPDDRCHPDRDVTTFCEGTVAVTCHGAYREFAVDCLGIDGGVACIDDGRAACVVDEPK
jgi:hypothetical protein